MHIRRGQGESSLSFNVFTSYIATGSDVAGFTNSLTLAAWINTTNASRTEAIFSNSTPPAAVRAISSVRPRRAILQ